MRVQNRQHTPLERLWPCVWTVLAVAYAAAAVFGVYGWLAGPRLGVGISFSSGEPLISSVRVGGEPWLAGIKEGDRVLSLDGAAPSEASLLHTGSPREVTVRSVRTGTEVSVDYRSASAVGMGPSLETVAFLFAAIGTLVFFRSARSAETLNFAFFCMAAAIALATSPAAVLGHVWGRLVVGPASLGAALFFVSFFSKFGDRRPAASPAGSAWVTAGALVLPAALVPVLVAGMSGDGEVYRAARSGVLILMLASFGAGCAALVFRYSRTGDNVVREQIRTVLLGTLLAVAPFVLLSMLPEAIAGSFIVRPHVTALAAVLIPLSFGYAIQRHRLMGIRRLVRRGVVYALLTMAVVAVYAVAVTTLRLVAGDGGTSPFLELGLFLALVAGVPLIAGARQAASAFADRLLYRDRPDHREILRGLSLEADRENGLREVVVGVLERLKAGLALDFAVYVAPGREGVPELAGAAGSGQGPYMDAALTGKDPWQRPLATVWKFTAPAQTGEAMAGAVRGPGSGKGLILLGPKASGESFDSQDAEMLQTVCGLVSAAVARAESAEEMEQTRRQINQLGARIAQAGEKEREEIASYLHDEPLQKLAFALGQYRERALPEDLAGMLEDVARDLRNMSASLTPQVLHDLGLYHAVEWLAHEAGRKGPQRVLFEAQGVSSDDRFDQEIELAAYRTVQEGLTNCRKHSGAKAVWVTVSRADGRLTVSVEDNGAGLPAAGREPHDGRVRLGLGSLSHRLERLGGSLSISQRKPRGTRLFAELPVSPAGQGAPEMGTALKGGSS